MRATGLVFGSRDYIGSTSPPAAGPLEDISPFGNDGTFKASGEPAWVQLASGLWVMEFDGSDDYATITSSDSLEDLEDKATVMAWVKMASTGQNSKSIIMKTEGSPYYSYGLQITSNRIGFVCDVGGVTKRGRGDDDPYTSLDWQFHVGRYDGAEAAAFVNGVKQATTEAATGNIGTDSNVLSLGAWKTGSEFAACQMGLVRVLNRVVDDQEIKDLFQVEKHWFGVT